MDLYDFISEEVTKRNEICHLMAKGYERLDIYRYSQRRFIQHMIRRREHRLLKQNNP